MTKATIIGIPLDLGAGNLGVSKGPNAFRHQKIVEKLSKAGFTVIDAGNVECRPRKQLQVGNPTLRYLNEIIRVAEESAKQTFQCIQKGEKVIALGGDHSICLGVISGASVALDGQLGLIYFDVHGDMHTAETTLTGNIHGMSLAALMGFGDPRLTNVFKPKRKISKEHMLHIGGNDIDSRELELIEKENLQCFKVIDMLSDGFKSLFERINELSKKVNNIWVSLDLDVIDKMYAPGVSMLNKAGFTYREITTIAGYIGQHCNVVGVDIDEYDPLRDIENKTAELGIELIAKLFGSNYNWYTNYLDKNKLVIV